jgi:hypothetical protein
MLKIILNSANVLRAFYLFGYFKVMSGNHLTAIGKGVDVHHGLGIMSLFPESFWQVVTPSFTFLILGLSTVTVFLYPENWRARFVWWFSVVLVVHFYFMTGHTNYHSFHLMIYVSFLLIFWSTENAYQRSLVLHACIAVVGATYFSSGLWKALEVKKLIVHGKAAKFSLIATNSLAYATAEGSAVSQTCTAFLLSSSLSSASAWFFTILTEISGVIVLFVPQYALIWIPMVFLMHFSIGSCLGIWFVPAMGTLVTVWALKLLSFGPFHRQLSLTPPTPEKL